MAGSLKVTARVDVSGPLLTGQAGHALADATDAIAQAVADEAVRELRAFPMDKTGRATGAFQRELHPVRKDPGTYSVMGPMIRGVVWSPWLEGSSKRNESTGFRGYRLFAKTRLDLDRRVRQIAEDKLQEYIGQMGGGE